MTHSELVRRAEKWLRNSMRCLVVLSEPSGSSEIPDAVGWRLGGRVSYLVECKTSRSDFKRDQKKWFRGREDRGVGQFQYYMTPPGLLRSEDIPDGWGLVEVHPRSVKKVVEAKRRNFSKGTRLFFEEMSMLYSEIRKIQMIQLGKIEYLEASASVRRLLTLLTEQDGSGI